MGREMAGQNKLQEYDGVGGILSISRCVNQVLRKYHKICVGRKDGERKCSWGIMRRKLLLSDYGSRAGMGKPRLF